MVDYDNTMKITQRMGIKFALTVFLVLNRSFHTILFCRQRQKLIELSANSLITPKHTCTWLIIIVQNMT